MRYRRISMRRWVSLLAVLVWGLMLTSCEQDEDIVFGRLVRYTWVGDLGFSDRWGEPLESGLYFDDNGFGEDEQCYYASGRVAYNMPFRWRLYDNTLILDYGNDYPLLEIRRLYVGADELTGDLFVDSRYYDHIILYRY